MTQNAETFTLSNVVERYTRDTDLQPPEATILAETKNLLGSRRMLDIGVGAGRTTPHFAPLVRAYSGIDISPPMIAACRARFAHWSNTAFQVCDVRHLRPRFEKASFDFVLFSYNGIDYIEPDERKETLIQIREIITDDGLFAFSTHNLHSARDWYRLQSVSRLRRYIRMRRNNPSRRDLERMDYCALDDGGIHARLRTCYVRPNAQTEQLKQVGFKDIRVFRLDNGSEIESPSGLASNREPWLYFLCRAA